MAPVAMVSRYSHKHIKFTTEPSVGRHSLKPDLLKLSLEEEQQGGPDSLDDGLLRFHMGEEEKQKPNT